MQKSTFSTSKFRLANRLSPSYYLPCRLFDAGRLQLGNDWLQLQLCEFALIDLLILMAAAAAESVLIEYYSTRRRVLLHGGTV